MNNVVIASSRDVDDILSCLSNLTHPDDLRVEGSDDIDQIKIFSSDTPENIFYYPDITRYMIELCLDTTIERDIISLGSTCKKVNKWYNEVRVMLVNIARSKAYTSLTDKEFIRSIVSSVGIDSIPSVISMELLIHCKAHPKRYILSLLIDRFSRIYPVENIRITRRGKNDIADMGRRVIRDKIPLKEVHVQEKTSDDNVASMRDSLKMKKSKEFICNLRTSMSRIDSTEDLIKLDTKIAYIERLLSHFNTPASNTPVEVPSNSVTYKHGNPNDIQRRKLYTLITDIDEYISEFITYLSDIADPEMVRKSLSLISSCVSEEKLKEIIRKNISNNRIKVIELLLPIYKGDIRSNTISIPSLRMLEVLQKHIGEVSSDDPDSNILSKIEYVNTHLLIPRIDIYLVDILKE